MFAGVQAGGNLFFLSNRRDGTEECDCKIDKKNRKYHPTINFLLCVLH